MKEPKYISIYLYAQKHGLAYDTAMRRIIKDKKAPTKIITVERVLIREDYKV